jgi:hypothetical protein
MQVVAGIVPCRAEREQPDMGLFKRHDRGVDDLIVQRPTLGDVKGLVQMAREAQAQAQAQMTQVANDQRLRSHARRRGGPDDVPGLRWGHHLPGRRESAELPLLQGGHRACRMDVTSS